MSISNTNPNFSPYGAFIVNAPVSAANFTYNTPYYPQYIEDSESDGDSAKNAGAILIGGMLLREFLQKNAGKIMGQYLSKNRKLDDKEILDTSLNMLKDKGLLNDPQQFAIRDGSLFRGQNAKLDLIIENDGSKAYFDHMNKQICVTKKTLLALPHEIGHAVQENCTTFLKKLQRSRGMYAYLAMFLYGMGRKKSNDPNAEQTTTGKLRNILYKYSLGIPLLAYSPELITEFQASKIGIKYLKDAKVSKSLLSAAKKHYAVAFCTYLALPLFAIMDAFIFKKANK